MAELTPSRSSSKGLSTEERQAYRKSFFKRGGTLHWRNTYRERCSNRLKRNREALLDRCRYQNSSSTHDNISDSVYSVMQQEWDQLKSELNLPDLPIGSKRSPSSPAVGAISPKRPDISEDEQMQLFVGCVTPERCPVTISKESEEDSYTGEDIDYILSLMDEITQELIAEEQSVISQYEDNLRFSEMALSSAISSMSEEGSADDEVICPICLKNVLKQDRQIIHCDCGLSIDTEQDGITLDYVRRQLIDGSSTHSQGCSAIPVFKMDGVLGLQNLIMTCTVCDFMYIIM